MVPLDSHVCVMYVMVFPIIFANNWMKSYDTQKSECTDILTFFSVSFEIFKHFLAAFRTRSLKFNLIIEVR